MNYRNLALSICAGIGFIFSFVLLVAVLEFLMWLFPIGMTIFGILFILGIIVIFSYAFYENLQSKEKIKEAKQ